MDKHDNIYTERNSGINIAEIRFEEFCRKHHLEFHRFGFDEKKDPISKKPFQVIPAQLRSLPDYLVTKSYWDEVWFCEVKGTNKVKVVDLKIYYEFVKQYCRNSHTHFYLYLAFEDEVYRFSLTDLIDIYKKRKNQLRNYEDNDKAYFLINTPRS